MVDWHQSCLFIIRIPSRTIWNQNYSKQPVLLVLATWGYIQFSIHFFTFDLRFELFWARSCPFGLKSATESFSTQISLSLACTGTHFHIWAFLGNPTLSLIARPLYITPSWYIHINIPLLIALPMVYHKWPINQEPHVLFWFYCLEILVLIYVNMPQFMWK